MWLILLAVTYVMYHGFGGCLGLIVSILSPSFEVTPSDGTIFLGTVS